MPNRLWLSTFLLGFLMALGLVSSCGGVDDSPKDQPPPSTNPVPPSDPTYPPADRSSLPTLRQDLLTLINQERARLRVRTLLLENRLNGVAQAHAEDMVRRNYFSHRNPEGESAATRLQRAGWPYRAMSENIAKGHRSAEEVLQAWLGSQGHRRNIRDAGFARVGIGYFSGHWVFLATN